MTGDDEKDAKEFYSTFLHAFTSSHVDRGSGVGGFPTAVGAGPDGHRYRFHSFHHSWKPIEFLPSVEQHQDPFHHSIIPPQQPGIAVLAAQVQQARQAFIYSPLFNDEAERIEILEPGIDWTEHQVVMNDRTAAALELASGRDIR